MNIVNLAAYRFVSLDDLPSLRERVLERAEALALKGTVLLAPEGINLFLAGPREAVDAFMAWLRADARFAGLEAKESISGDVPFGRLRVRLKKEIITMHMPAIRPEGGRAPAVDAPTLKRWLDQGHDDEGRDVVMLDTRNDYETDVGRFAHAVDYRLASFTAFPAAVAADRARFADKTVVSYCTGGIRCEKAALHMQELGIECVRQLEGGILKYLELTDGAHWQGDCFVFDGRGAVGSNLLPASELPLPSGERAGARGHACDEPSSKPALGDTCASTRPSPQSSPRRGEEANATSASFDWSGA
ncbi:sulfurtransferase [Rhodanobacter sp. PCA2]|uniref:sulfurtransferase n=1 Tax=Rhodanobacter sp. PCA2 TaxID=2006117 RepID=UPI0015E79223|nr:sulfurtransferase [Rhodanobacter sp. PCA2]MBA2079885.1 sulfurtransferase [Rhodanobacter sp. PCA2]